MNKTPTILGFLIDSAAKLIDQLKMVCGRVFLFLLFFNFNMVISLLYNYYYEISIVNVTLM
ncbi:hypothetical protein BK702_22985 [Bacillus thuringiensis serovar cameroun]|nr:hypothetical protein BK702_22985 [Bacillus thuringiensis serovar cameroun]